MRLLRQVFPAFAALLLSACAQAGFVVANVPAHYDSVKRHTDVAYGGGALQKLDIYVPKIQNPQDLPVIVFIHGGRWTEGHKDQYQFFGTRLAREGYVVVIPDYRKYPDVKFPALMEDPAAAVAWVHQHIAAYGGRAEGLYLMGHSSGAHVGALISADERYLQAQGLSTKIIRGFVGLAGPYHFTPDEPDLVDMFGPPENYPQMQVGTFMQGGEPPMLLLWGQEDTLVGMINIDNVVKEAQGSGDQITAITYPKLDHVGIMAAFTWIYEKRSRVVEDVLAFLAAREKQ